MAASFAAQDLGINSMQIIAKATDSAGAALLDQVKDAENERKKKLMQLGGNTSLAAQALLGNMTGGFGG